MELLPTTANPFKLHRQAKRFLKSTSRAKNPDWYSRSNELDLQWHLWVGPHQVVSAIFHRPSNQWFEGPSIPAVSFDEDDHGIPTGLDSDSRNQLHEVLRQILATKQFGGKPKSLGITFHLADGIRVRELAPEFAADTNFDTVNELLASAPDIALGDDSIDNTEGSWHLFPLLGVQEGDKWSVGVQVSSQYQFIVDELREYGELRNIPVVAEVISAALESIAALPLLYPEGGSFEDTISLVQFDAFTLLCATGRSGAIQMIRPIPHRMTSTLSPSEIAELIANSAALLNLKAPQVILVSMPGIPEEELQELLSPYLEVNPEAKTHCINAKMHAATEPIPGRRFELAFYSALPSMESEPTTPLELIREKWAIQDFCGKTAEEIKQMPTRADLRLLRMSSIGQKVALVALFAFAGWTGMDFFSKMTTEEWKLPPDAADEMQLELITLQKEKNEWEYWENILAKRSEGWTAMETLLAIFPDDGGVILNSASYTAKGTDPDTKKNTLGITRQWSLSGYANPKVATNLPSLGSKIRVIEIMNKIAAETRADYLAIDSETRDLKVSFQQKQGSMPPTKNFPANVARHFRTAFELGIQQTVSSDDNLALQTSPLKKK